MSNIDQDIVKDFMVESKVLLRDLVDLLEKIEGDFSQVLRLGEYAQKVDRIAGGAKGLALMMPPEHVIHMVADYAALCRVVGERASQINGNPQLYDVCVALLLDATEALSEGVGALEKVRLADELKNLLPKTFSERLRWFLNKFAADSKKVQKLDQNEIDNLLKKLGMF